MGDYFIQQETQLKNSENIKFENATSIKGIFHEILIYSAGHLVKMDECSQPNTLLFGKLYPDQPEIEEIQRHFENNPHLMMHQP